MKTTCITVWLIVLCMACTTSTQPLSAQSPVPGSIDPSFAMWPTRRPVQFILTQSNDLFVAGPFGAARLTADGVHNPAFAPTSIAGVTALALQPDGKLLAGFRQFGDVSRFLPDGSLDSSFNFVPPDVHWRIVSFWTTALALQPDGKILVAGYRLVLPRDFDNDAYWAFRQVYRLSADGSLDSTFATNYATVRVLAALADDRILLGGNHLTLLHPDGTTDTNFVAGPFLGPLRYDESPNENEREPLVTKIDCLAIQPDGRILVGGSFTNVQGHTRTCLARVLPDGRLDSSFTPPTFTGHDFAQSRVTALALQADGRILIGGLLRTDQWSGIRSLARLNPDGSVDATFPPMIEGFDDDEDHLGIPSTIVIQDETRAVIGGDDLDFGDLFRIHLGELLPPRCDGFCITAFDVQTDLVTITWRSQPGSTYYIDHKPTLANSDWTPASGAIIAQSTHASWTISRPPGTSAFYRVVRLED